MYKLHVHTVEPLYVDTIGPTLDDHFREVFTLYCGHYWANIKCPHYREVLLYSIYLLFSYKEYVMKTSDHI